jgi:beta-lactamase class D
MKLYQRLLAFLFICINATIIFTGCAGSNATAQQEREIDYAEYFQGIEGTAVFYNTEEQMYYTYNKDLAEQPSSPCSSFKIISCLMGLESGVIDPLHSTLKWDGVNYPVEDWNKDLDYRQAFKVSAIWYFRKVINLVGEDYVQDILNKLVYGNCDISKWEGSLNNILFPTLKDREELNGFWQESSLEISPRQQVNVVRKIFEDKDVFSQENLNLVKELMLVDNGNSPIKIYGKTGSGIKDDAWVDAWFVGMFESNGQTTYFAIRLNQPGASGLKAKEVAVNIISNEFGE